MKFFTLKRLVDYGLFDNILYVCVILHVFLFDRIVVFGIVTVGSACFYVIAWNQECFFMNKIGNFVGEVESDFDLVDYYDWAFVNSILRMN